MTQAVESARRDLVAANRILGHEGILDAYGHVSVRHPEDPTRFLLSRARAPELVEETDVLEFDLDGEAVHETGAVAYLERFIHAAIYEARPDVHAVCHNHTLSILPFSISATPLRATIYDSRPFGDGVPVWDIADEFGTATDLLVRTIDQGRSLARTLGDRTLALMRGHGSAVVARDARHVVSACLAMDRGARAQLSTVLLGPTRPGDASELEPTTGLDLDVSSDARVWEYLCRRAGVTS